jgi:hypothetical protein
MQTIIVDGTTYKVKFDRDPLEKKPKDIRKFPTWSPAVSTAEYIERFDNLNNLARVEYHGASAETAAQYDSTIPLLEEVNNG